MSGAHDGAKISKYFERLMECGINHLPDVRKMVASLVLIGICLFLMIALMAVFDFLPVLLSKSV
jgi:hypothetical protein